MKKYKFEKIKNIFVTGGCQGELKEFFKELKKHLMVKEEDREGAVQQAFLVRLCLGGNPDFFIIHIYKYQLIHKSRPPDGRMISLRKV